MRRISYISKSGDFAEKPIGIFIATTKCSKCGNATQIAIDKDVDFDRTESDYWQQRYYNLMGELNTLLRTLEVETGWNPHKESLIKKLIALREELAKNLF